MLENVHLQVPRYGLELEIELLYDLAPITTDALLEALPATGLVTSESNYGSVVCLRLPNFRTPLQPENATIFPIPGDVFVFEHRHGAELVVFYERMGGAAPAGAPFDSCGLKAGNRVGFTKSALGKTTARDARRIWSEGAAWGAAGQRDSNVVRSAKDSREEAQAEIEARLATWHQLTRRDHMGAPPGGRPRVTLVIPEYGARTQVELETRAAPHSCENIWNHLPVDTVLMHGRYSGPEMFTQIGGAKWHWSPQRENQTTLPTPGDMVLYFGPPPRIQINYFHDRDAIPYGTTKPEPGNLVGWSVDDFGSFAEACWRIGYEGWKTLVIERVE